MSPAFPARALRLVSAALGLAFCAACTTPSSAPRVSGDAVIRGRAGPSDIVITTTTRVAGAVHSLRWQEHEFIDSTDHGRQLQSAANFDAGILPIRAETFNPTEAGSRRDHVGPKSSSRLLRFEAAANSLVSTTQMAFWLAPGEASSRQPARNATVLSNHLLTKRITIGTPGHPHVIAYDVVFTVPAGEQHHQAVFEALTGYMPAEFSRFWRFDAATGHLQPLSDGPGEQSDPVVLATPSGEYAMGIWSPDPGARYGRFRFAAAHVVKWNCVFRVGRGSEWIAPGDYAFRHRVIVGDLETVRANLAQLVREAYAAK